MSKLSSLSTKTSESTDFNQTSTDFHTSRCENESDESDKSEDSRSSLESDWGSSATTSEDEGTDKLHPVTCRTGKEIQVECQDKTNGSPAASYCSMKSDRSMNFPLNFSHKKDVARDPYTRQMMREHLRCTECKDVLKEPVSITCGHSFCNSCIQSYWSRPAQIGNYSCPQCKMSFTTRPALSLNVTLANVVQTHQRAGFSPAVPVQSYAGPGGVPCDSCTRNMIRAVKTCLTCSVSYCEAQVNVPNDLINNLMNQVKQLQNQVTNMEVKLEDMQRSKTEDEPPRKCLRTQLDETPGLCTVMSEVLDYAVPNYEVPQESSDLSD